MNHVLVLNADWSPLQVLPWERVICLVLDSKVAVVADYEGRQIRSPGCSIPWPAVVTLNDYVRIRLNVGVTRRNVLARDNFMCQYCGVKPQTARSRPVLEELTVDHVVPRAQSLAGRVTLPWSGARVPVGAWENTVASCITCNQQKGARTPEEAGMPLLRVPRAPSYGAMVAIALAEFRIPREWLPYLPEESVQADSEEAA